MGAWLDKQGLGACKKGLASVTSLSQLANMSPAEIREATSGVDAATRSKLMKAVDTITIESPR